MTQVEALPKPGGQVARVRSAAKRVPMEAVALTALALVIGELGQYWVHRMQHEVPWLWRFHALHHSAPRLYWLNAARFHPFDILINNFAAIVVLVVLGASQNVLLLWALTRS